MLGDSAYVGYIYNNTGQKKDRLVLVDRQGETLNTFPQYDQFTIANGLNYYLWGITTVISILSGKKPVVKSIIMIRSLRLPRNGLNPAISWIWESIRYRKKGVLKFWKEIGKLFRTGTSYLRPDFHETSQWVFLPYTSWDVTNKDELPRLAMYDKKKGACYKVKNNRIINDMQGSLPFYPETRISDDVLLYFLEAPEIMELAEDDPSILEYEQLKISKRMIIRY